MIPFLLICVLLLSCAVFWLERDLTKIKRDRQNVDKAISQVAADVLAAVSSIPPCAPAFDPSAIEKRLAKIEKTMKPTKAKRPAKKKE